MRYALLLAALILLAGCGGLKAASRATTAPAQTAATLMAQLQAAGLPMADPVTYTAATDPNELLGRPNGYASKSDWRETRIDASDQTGSDRGGGLEVFTDAAGAQARMAYIQGIAKASPMLNEYDFVQGPVLLRLSAQLTPDQTAQYQAALKAAVR